MHCPSKEVAPRMHYRKQTLCHLNTLVLIYLHSVGNIYFKTRHNEATQQKYNKMPSNCNLSIFEEELDGSLESSKYVRSSGVYGRIVREGVSVCVNTGLAIWSQCWPIGQLIITCQIFDESVKEMTRELETGVWITTKYITYWIKGNILISTGI